MPFWRMFPWDPHAPDGAPFSIRYLPPAGTQTGGRFDLGDPPVLYLAQDATHALTELLHGFRGTPLLREHLLRPDPTVPGTYHPLSLVEAQLPRGMEARLPDLADPAVLVDLDIRPDQLASHDRTVTQAISRRVHASRAGYPGFRWWSALTGEWHVTVLFMDRVDPRSIEYTSPDPLEIVSPAVQAAARFLRMPIPRSR
jgi:hypothetical protein